MLIPSKEGRKEHATNRSMPPEIEKHVHDTKINKIRKGIKLPRESNALKRKENDNDHQTYNNHHR